MEIASEAIFIASTGEYRTGQRKRAHIIIDSKMLWKRFRLLAISKSEKNRSGNGYDSLDHSKEAKSKI
jgi:hypothetical protein